MIIDGANTSRLMHNKGEKMVGGKTIFGNIEHVKGKYYVATQFYHLMFFPLIPLQSFLVFEGTETSIGFQGLKIPLNTKSILIAYFRSFIVVIGTITLIRALILLSGQTEDEPNPLLPGIVRLTISTVSFSLYFASYVLLYADKKREEFFDQYIKSNLEE